MRRMHGKRYATLQRSLFRLIYFYINFFQGLFVLKLSKKKTRSSSSTRFNIIIVGFSAIFITNISMVIIENCLRFRGYFRVVSFEKRYSLKDSF